jgi:FkbM family methyltransferase
MPKLAKVPWSRLYGRKRYQPFFQRMHRTALLGLGLGNSDPKTNGELYLLHTLLPAWDRPLLIDAGAFHGEWSKAALELAPSATVHALEPNRDSFLVLKRELSGRAKAHNVALGSDVGSMPLYAPPGLPTHGSLHLRDLSSHGLPTPELVGEVPVITLDAFCQEQRITAVDLLKLDVEGNEVAALEGAKGLIDNGAIRVIQFEFGGANIDSRTYLRDFMDRLAGNYNVHRILRDGLEPLVYGEASEVFIYGNFAAIRK